MQNEGLTAYRVPRPDEQGRSVVGVSQTLEPV